jgi:cold shock CspA family protein
MTGVVVRIVRGQSHGYIRATGYRAVFFHRMDVADRAFNDLAIGDRLAFRVIDDPVSGPRAIHVRKAGLKG